MHTAKLSKQRIAAAKSLAKDCGVELMGWHDGAGKEFVIVTGAGDKLRIYEQQMVSAGWISWPVNGTVEGSYMEFAMRPPSPADVVPRSNHEVPVAPDYTPQEFRYRGLTSGYLSGAAIVWGVLAFLGYRSAGRNYLTTPLAQAVAAMAILAVVAGALLPFHLVEIHANAVLLRYRSLMRGRKEVRVSDIESVSLYADDPEKKPKESSVLIVLRSGLRIDLHLPLRERTGLVAFLKAKLPRLPPRQS